MRCTAERERESRGCKYIVPNLPEHLYNAHECSVAVTHKNPNHLAWNKKCRSEGGARRSTTISFIFSSSSWDFIQSISFLYTHELVRARRT